jgi:cytochrome c-type biogenesis protein CcmH
MGVLVPFPQRFEPEKSLSQNPPVPSGKPGSSGRWRFWIRATQALVLATVVFFSLGATDASSRFNDLGHRMMCTCGCAQLLGECNHVGCPESGRERQELSANIAAGMTDQKILDWFAAKYGATMLAAPPAKGFDLVAWIAPFAVFLAALAGTILLIRRWGGLGGDKQKLQAAAANELDPAERERREKIRREIEGEI